MKEVFFEQTIKGRGYFFFVEKLFEEQSKYQHIVIAKSDTFGKALFIDGVIQFSEKDEFFYHEALIQPAVHLLGGVKKALILGGGDALAAREFLKHSDVEKVVMVDIDDVVVNSCKKYFPELNKSVYEDPRFELIVGDAFKYIEETKDKFDVVVMDLTDPGEPGELFYKDSFFQLCKKVMKERSIFVTHASSFSTEIQTAAKVFVDFRKSFKNAKIYRTDFIPSFDTTMGIMIGYDFDLNEDYEKIEEVYSKVKDKLKFYTPINHKAMFNLSKWAQDVLESAKPLDKSHTESQNYKFLKMDEFPLD